MRSLFAALVRTIRRVTWHNRDLAALWVALAVVQPLLAPGQILVRDDLMPWVAVTLAAAVFIRGGRLGPGPHPMLVPRRTWSGRIMRALGASGATMTLAFAYDLGLNPDPDLGGQVVVSALAVAAALWLSRDEGRTSWNPRRGTDLPVWIAMAVASILVSILLGNLDHRYPEGSTSWAARGLQLGLNFLVVGIIYGAPRNQHQRASAGRTDGGPYRPEVFRPLLALLGPGAGLWMLLALADAQIGPIGFTQGFVGSLFVLAWVGVIWPTDPPVTVPCMLHEVVPDGGRDRPGDAAARGFERPPEGALRLNPLEVRRTRSVHPWLVPVRASRIQELDDPVRPLWLRTAPPVAAHILGEAAFEPDPVTGAVQTDVLTLRIARRTDMSSLTLGGAQYRRVVVITPFPDVGEEAEETPTYLWDDKLPRGSLQVLDAATDELRLTDGCILVLSAEGVARAYELEIGKGLPQERTVKRTRPPQLEDYTEAG
ncbi:MAG: hypothetical protein H6739_34870 [Alphaproteobacteria bacterium]|nr:hypothetical protein [Alphaproteobacteria bacterium]